MAKFFYSVIRFVPDVARGEFVNVGLCLIEASRRCDEEFGWIGYQGALIKRDWQRAMAFSGWSLENIGNAVNDLEFPQTYDELLDESLRSDVIQYSHPLPAISESGNELFIRIWKIMVKDQWD